MDRVVGPPGCGKTTWLSRQVALAYDAGHSVMVCSLTNAAATEIAHGVADKQNLRLPKEAMGTLHSHAYHALRRGKIGIAEDREHLAEWNEAHPEMLLSGGRTLDEDTMHFEMDTEADACLADYNNQRARLISREYWRQSTQGFAKLWEGWKREQDLLDFTDLLELALRDCDTAPGNPSAVFADEAQDFSALEMALLQKWGEEAGRLVVVGDPWQSLFEWRGADAGLVFPVDEIDRVLSQSYRVPQAVHSCAMRWIEKMPGYSPIEYRPTAEPGEVHPCAATADRPERALDVVERALADGKSVMYLASCARMLKPTLALMRQRGIPFHNDYRAAEGAWNPLRVRRTGVTGAQRLAAFLQISEAGTWSKEDVRRWGPAVKGSETFPGGISWKKMETAVNNLVDNEIIDIGLWETLVGRETVDAGMGQDLGWWLEHLLASRREAAQYPANIAKHRGRGALLATPAVTVGTIHSVKGGEADVVLLAPDVSVPGATEWAASDAGKASIYRLFYVGITRARESLHILQPVKRERAVRLI